MKLVLLAIALGIIILALAACRGERKGEELRLKHEVVVQTPEGDTSYHSVLSLEAYQHYIYGAGTSGWGGITALATGQALHVPIGDNDYFFLLVQPSPTPSTPGWSQMALLKTHFGFPNATMDEEWIDIWRKLAESDRAVNLTGEQIPGIAVMPRDGWMDDARVVTPIEARQLGLRIKEYRLEITRDPVNASHPVDVRYRPSEARYQPIGTLGRHFFVAERER